jgi:uncharacterized protein YndB with AHSA1/START domain
VLGFLGPEKANVLKLNKRSKQFIKMTTSKILNKTIDINAPTSKVWNMLTNPEMIKEWLFGTNVISEWKVGNPILFKGVWQGKAYEDKGTIFKFENEKILQYNYWSGFSGLADSPENYSIITFELAQKGNETRLKLTQSNFATETMYDHSDENWETTLALMKKVSEEKNQS